MEAADGDQAGAADTTTGAVAELLVAVLVGAQTAVALGAGADLDRLLRGAEALLGVPPSEAGGRPEELDGGPR